MTTFEKALKGQNQSEHNAWEALHNLRVRALDLSVSLRQNDHPLLITVRTCASVAVAGIAHCTSSWRCWFGRWLAAALGHSRRCGMMVRLSGLTTTSGA